MESTAFKSKFMAQLNNSFGSGGMSLAFNDNQFSLFLQSLKREAGRSLPIRKAATVIGRQTDSAVWVVGKELQINGEGDIIPKSEHVYMWLDETINETLSTICLEEVLPEIVIPLNTTVLHRYQHTHTRTHTHVHTHTYSLHGRTNLFIMVVVFACCRLVEVLQIVMQHDFFPSLLMCAGALLAA